MARKLIKILPKKSGRNATGKITTRHQGGREKRFLREIDFKRDKKDIKAKVMSIEYDPNRTADIALLFYADGEKRYIISPVGLEVGQELLSGEEVEVKPGNALPLNKIPLGTVIHNIELRPGKGGQIARGAGTGTTLMSKEEKNAILRLPSGEQRKISLNCYATVGQIGNVDWKNRVFKNAGIKRHMGIRPTVRGVAQNPSSHPHGGGEGKSGIGMPSPKSPWGKPTLGYKTRRNKSTEKYIVSSRHAAKRK